MNVDFVGMLMEVVDGAIAVAQGLALGGDMVTLGLAAAAIILSALFMGSLEQLISTTMTSLFLFVVLQIVYGAYGANWDFSGPVNGVWESFAGADPLTFFTFFSYFIVFAVAIAIVNIVKNMVAG